MMLRNNTASFHNLILLIICWCTIIILCDWGNNNNVNDFVVIRYVHAIISNSISNHNDNIQQQYVQRRNVRSHTRYLQTSSSSLLFKSNQIVYFQLFDQTTNQQGMKLYPGANTTIYNISNSNSINIRAVIQSEINPTTTTTMTTTNNITGSMKFILRQYITDVTGNRTTKILYVWYENVIPYTLCSTTKTCKNLFTSSSSYLLTAIPYSGTFGTETKGKSISTSFTLIPTTQDGNHNNNTTTINTNILSTLPTNGTWGIYETSAPITARHESCAVYVNGSMYLIGGRNVAPIDIYHISTNTWSTGPAPPISLHHMQCIVVDDTYVYIVSAFTYKYPIERTINYTYVYDTQQQIWSTKTGLPQNRQRGSAASILVGRKIYVSHGNIGGHATINHTMVQSVGWFDYYNIDTDTWVTNLPNAPHPRDHTGGALVNNGTMICISGGRDGSMIGWPVVNETDCYDLKKGQWITDGSIPDIPISRSGSSYGTTCDGQLMIAGGEGPQTVYNTVHTFNGILWTTYPNLYQARHGSSLVVNCDCCNNNQYPYQNILLPTGSGGPKGGPLLYSIEKYLYESK